MALPNGMPDGVMGFETADGTFTIIRPCDICGAAILEGHDADYALHTEWHERTGTL